MNKLNDIELNDIELKKKQNEKIARIREQTRNRVNKWYDKNKDEFKLKRLEAKNIKKAENAKDDITMENKPKLKRGRKRLIIDMTY